MDARRDESMPASGRWVRAAGVFLAVSYGVGAPFVALLEYHGGVLSQRFGYPPELIYVVSAIQAACAVGVLVARFTRLAAAVLTVITLGAIVSHIRIGSPLTGLSALLYTVVQIWFGFMNPRRVGGSNQLAAAVMPSNKRSPGEGVAAQGLDEPARPRKTRIARFRRTRASSSSRPTYSPTLRRRTVVSLSTIRLLGSRSPFRSVGLTRIRKSGASVGSVVKAQIVTDEVASKWSSWMMTAGRGLPA